MYLKVGKVYFDKWGAEYVIVMSRQQGKERYYYNTQGEAYTENGACVYNKDVPHHYNHLISEVTHD